MPSFVWCHCVPDRRYLTLSLWKLADFPECCRYSFLLLGRVRHRYPRTGSHVGAVVYISSSSTGPLCSDACRVIKMSKSRRSKQSASLELTPVTGQWLCTVLGYRIPLWAGRGNTCWELLAAWTGRVASDSLILCVWNEFFPAQMFCLLMSEPAFWIGLFVPVLSSFTA